VVDRIEPIVAKTAEEWPAWGHRKVWAMARYDGHDVGSASSVARAICSNPLLTRPNAANLLKPARQRLLTRQPDGTGSGTLTSVSSKPLVRAPGILAGSSTTPPKWCLDAQ